MSRPRGMIAALLLCFPACGKNDSITTYRLAKEAPPSAAANSGGMTVPPGMAPAASPAEINWKVPSGWRTQPASAMRVGNFLVPGEDGRLAEVSVVPL